MPNVIIPPEKVELLKVGAYREWLLEHTRAGVQGHMVGGTYALRFEDADEAEAFRARWLEE